jgi:hypothetical protein
VSGATPTRIWICVPNKEQPDWVVERMTTADVAADGSFEIDASDGKMMVEPGFAVFEFNDHVYACRPNKVQEKLATAAGGDNEVVAELAQKTETMDTQKRLQRSASKARTAPTSEGYQLKLKPMIGSPPAPQFQPIANLQVDDTYQRSIEGGPSRKLIIKIAENWDWRLCLPLLVSRRNGELFVIDGQHRKEAAELRGDILHLPVVVFDFDDPQAEAELFIAANRSRRAMTQLDDFHAAVVAGDPKAMAVHDAVTVAGLAIGRNQAWQYWKPGEVVFVTTIQRALHSKGPAIVGQALGMIARAFDGLVLTGIGAVFHGLVTIIQQRQREQKPIEPALMETVLREVGIPGWREVLEGVTGGADRGQIMCKALLDAYAEAEGE